MRKCWLSVNSLPSSIHILRLVGVPVLSIAHDMVPMTSSCGNITRATHDNLVSCTRLQGGQYDTDQSKLHALETRLKLLHPE